MTIRLELLMNIHILPPQVSHPILSFLTELLILNFVYKRFQSRFSIHEKRLNTPRQTDREKWWQILRFFLQDHGKCLELKLWFLLVLLGTGDHCPLVTQGAVNSFAEGERSLFMFRSPCELPVNPRSLAANTGIKISAVLAEYGGSLDDLERTGGKKKLLHTLHYL